MKLAKAKVNTTDIDPMRLTHTQTILLVYPGFVHNCTIYYNSSLKTRCSSDSRLNRTQDKIKQTDPFSNHFAHMSMCMCINHRTGTAWCFGPCDFNLGVKDVILIIPCQCYISTPTCLSLALK